MELQEIKTKIRAVITESTNIKPEVIGDDTLFEEDLELDSLTLLEIAVHLDQEFELDLPEEDMKGFTSVNVSAELVNQYMTQTV